MSTQVAFLASLSPPSDDAFHFLTPEETLGQPRGGALETLAALVGEAPDPGPATAAVALVELTAVPEDAGAAADAPRASLADAPDEGADAPALEANGWWRQVQVAAAAHDAGDFTGRGQSVVVIDTGFSWRYDQSATRYAYDFSGRNDANASVDTLYSHGSWVAQVATRVAEDVDIIHLKVFDDAGRGASIVDIEQALRWVVANADRFDVAAVNLSLGYGNATRETRSRLSDEFAALDALDVVNVVAAGNSYASFRSGVNVLAADPNVVGVSAVTASDRFTSFSQRHHELTDIAALGQNVVVRTVDGLVGRVSGTSFAAPYVSGAAAVLQEAAETVLGHRLDPDEVVDILQRSGDRVVGQRAYDGYRVADAEAAVDYFLDNALRYADALV